MSLMWNNVIICWILQRHLLQWSGCNFVNFSLVLMNPPRNEENRYTDNLNYQFLVWSDISPTFLYFPVPIKFSYEDHHCGASFMYIGVINIYGIKFTFSKLNIADHEILMQILATRQLPSWYCIYFTFVIFRRFRQIHHNWISFLRLQKHIPTILYLVFI